MAWKSVGFCVSVTTPKKRSSYIQGYLTKEQALKLALKLLTTSNKVEIDREYELGDDESDSRPFGVLKKVKRKDGYAVVIQTFDAYGFESWTYDVTKDGRFRNRR